MLKNTHLTNKQTNQPTSMTDSNTSTREYDNTTLSVCGVVSRGVATGVYRVYIPSQNQFQ